MGHAGSTYYEQSIFYSATLKAVLVRYYLPVYLLLCVFHIWIYGWSVWFDLLIVPLVAICTTVLSYKILNDGIYPFSESAGAIENTSTIKGFATMAVIGVFAGIHFMLGKLPYGTLGFMILLLVAIVIMWKLVFPSVKKGALADG